MVDEARPVLVWSTWPEGPPPDEVVHQLLTEQLVACVSVGAPSASYYRWQGKIECARECGVVMKTMSDRLARLEARWTALHPYEVPEFLTVEAAGGSAAYLSWLRDETRGA
jgi:periplasmic divalent cation tolerance protein